MFSVFTNQIEIKTCNGILQRVARRATKYFLTSRIYFRPVWKREKNLHWRNGVQVLVISYKTCHQLSMLSISFNEQIEIVNMLFVVFFFINFKTKKLIIVQHFPHFKTVQWNIV